MLPAILVKIVIIGNLGFAELITVVVNAKP
jgi:hypothetical protein